VPEGTEELNVRAFEMGYAYAREMLGERTDTQAM
jgi:Pyruvate/2-oxoacid:ferredoxin oxidoreductase gamma subunit